VLDWDGGVEGVVQDIKKPNRFWYTNK